MNMYVHWIWRRSLKLMALLIERLWDESLLRTPPRRFVDCQFVDCQFVNCRFVDCQFVDCQLVDCQFINCQFVDCQFVNCQYVDCWFIDCQFVNCQFVDCQFVDFFHLCISECCRLTLSWHEFILLGKYELSRLPNDFENYGALLCTNVF
jgi:uncharacterized protein YjbI with pentapeptide repeats